MEVPSLPPAVLAAAADREGGATEVAATALDGLLELAGEPDRLEQAVAVLLAGQPAMAPMWHLASAAHAPDPRAALTGLRHKGFVLDKSKRQDGTTFYRISSAPASDAGKAG